MSGSEDFIPLGGGDMQISAEDVSNSHEEQIKAAGEVRMERRHRARM